MNLVVANRAPPSRCLFSAATENWMSSPLAPDLAIGARALCLTDGDPA
jgi:hypothetical protein